LPINRGQLAISKRWRGNGLTSFCFPIRPNNRYLCMVPGCESSFSRSADLNRHYNSVHFPQNSRIDCPKHRCSRKGENGFPRHDHLKEHLRQYHGEGVPKRRPERFKLSNWMEWRELSRIWEVLHLRWSSCLSLVLSPVDDGRAGS